MGGGEVFHGRTNTCNILGISDVSAAAGPISVSDDRRTDRQKVEKDIAQSPLAVGA